MQIITLFVFIVLSQANFYDTTCPKFRCTKEELFERNYAKSLMYGNFSCISTIILFNPDGSPSSATAGTLNYYTYYDKIKGAIISPADNGANSEEYCGNNGGICLDEAEDLAAYYTESYDISKGKKGNAARLIQSYEKNGNKRIRRVQHLTTTKDGGESLVFFLLDENQKYVFGAFYTCTKISS